MGNTQALDQLKWLDKDIPDYIDEPPLKQSESADLVCKEHTTDVEWLEKHFSDESEDEFEGWNLCSLANVAYISLNSPEPYCSIAEGMRLKFINWYKSNH
jgi:hypothetical protein